MALLFAHPTVSVFIRHRASCPFAGDESYPKCECAKWLRYSLHGKQRRVAANTRAYGTALEKADTLQKQLDAGLAGKPTVAPDKKQRTIAEAIETYLTAKETENITPRRVKKLRFQLGQFERFMADRGKYFPAEITAEDAITFRAGWTRWQSTTRQKAQQNLRGFLRSCCKENLLELLSVLKTIKLSKADKARLEPKPFTEKELTSLLKQVPVSFSADAAYAAKMTALIHLMTSTGLAIRDAVQLQRAAIQDGWLRIERQKTDKAVRQKLSFSLCKELAAIANGNPQYIFWDGKILATSAVGMFQDDFAEGNAGRERVDQGQRGTSVSRYGDGLLARPGLFYD